MKQQVKQVPYGVSDFATVMSQNLYYVDKTMFLPELEKQPRNLFFVRPRRLGKMLSSVSAKACCLMHTVAADCSLWSTDVNGANGGISAFLSNFKVVGI